MVERTHRILVGLGLLAVVWLVTYWLWTPGTADRAPLVSVDSVEPEDGGGLSTPAGSVAGGADSGVRQFRDPARQDPPTSPGVTRPSGRSSTQTERRGTQSEVPESRATAPASIPPRVEAPRFREYVVREGDTFQRIAEREFGDSSRWQAVARANPLKDPRRLRPGDVIRLPVDPDNVQGRPAERVAGPGDEPEVVRYTVKPNDTLSGIAKTYYGSSGFADYIFHHNRDVLRDMNSLSVGQTLVLPPAPADE